MTTDDEAGIAGRPMCHWILAGVWQTDRYVIPDDGWLSGLSDACPSWYSSCAVQSYLELLLNVPLECRL